MSEETKKPSERGLNLSLSLDNYSIAQDRADALAAYEAALLGSPEFETAVRRIIVGGLFIPPTGAERTGPRPRIVCLCGSTRFFREFQEASLRETLAGKIVLSIGCNLRSDRQLWANETERDAIKTRLDDLHKRKIDLADEVLVLNIGNYIGDSTRSEVAYAEKLGKPVRWLEDRGGPVIQPVDAPYSLGLGLTVETGKPAEPAASVGEIVERTAQLAAHRACCGVEHDPANGKLHGYCVVCGVPWPCDYAGSPPTARPATSALPAKATPEMVAAFIRERDGGQSHDLADYINAALAAAQNEKKEGEKTDDKQ